MSKSMDVSGTNLVRLTCSTCTIDELELYYISNPFQYCHALNISEKIDGFSVMFSPWKFLLERKKYILIGVLSYVVIYHLMSNVYLRNIGTGLSMKSFHAILNFDIANVFNFDPGKHRFDIHIEDGQFGHTGEVLEDDNSAHFDRSRINIAVGGGITSTKLEDVTDSNIAEKFQLFHTLLPSFCQTASVGYSYNFYFAYDHTDNLFKNLSFVRQFQTIFLDGASRLCDKGVIVSIHMVQCSHSRRPTWAQNDAMLEAYLDNMDYYYRINDDTKFQTGNWTEAFIDVLKRLDLRYTRIPFSFIYLFTFTAQCAHAKKSKH